MQLTKTARVVFDAYNQRITIGYSDLYQHEQAMDTRSGRFHIICIFHVSSGVLIRVVEITNVF